MSVKELGDGGVGSGKRSEALIRKNTENDVVPVRRPSRDGHGWNRKRWTAIGLAFAVGCIAIFLFSGPAPVSADQKDVVNDFSKVSQRFNTQSFRNALEELRKMQPNDRAAYIDQNFPKLREEISIYLHDAGKLKPGQTVSSIRFLFGSATNVSAEDGDGHMNNGKFENQLIAQVHVNGQSDPINLIVLCTNGMFALPEGLQDLGSRAPQPFVIRPGEGLVPHVTLNTAIAWAKRFHIPLYKGKVMTKENLITPEQAININPDDMQVTVKVYAGDRFDPVRMTYDKGPRH